MKTQLKNGSVRTVFSLATALAVVLGTSLTSSLSAQGVLKYSFEDDVLPDPLHGFVRNPEDDAQILTLTRDTIGATEGTKSMKIELTQTATYVGAGTADLFSSINTDPVALHSMTFDLTIPTQFPLEGFVDIFVVFFGIGQNGEDAEVTFQFDTTNRVGIGDLAPGTYPITMEFNEGSHPLDFENFDLRPFGEIFGVQGSGPIDVIATGFQLTINKSTQAPWVGYVDNFRFFETEPVGTPGDFDGDGDVDGRDFLVWQRGQSPNPLTSSDLELWQTNYGTGGLTAGFVAVPEPATCGLLVIMAAAMGCGVRRKR